MYWNYSQTFLDTFTNKNKCKFLKNYIISLADYDSKDVFNYLTVLK